MRRVLLGVAIALAAGLAAAKPVTSDDAAQFKVGVATLADVEAKLGPPQTTSTNSDGIEIVGYTSSSTHVKAATYIPVVGWFAGGAKGHVSTIVFTFGADGVLKNTATSETNVDCGIGSCK